MTTNIKYFPINKTPRIYVYTTPTHKKDGWVKIGYTERLGNNKEAAIKRIEEQVAAILMPNKNEVYELLWVESAIYSDYSGFFTDKHVHKILSKEGYQRYTDNGKNSEWFKCDVKEIKNIIYNIKNKINLSSNINLNTYNSRPEQILAINKTKNYFNSNSKDKTKTAPHFLWNAKMRFGKTYTTYQLAKEMGWKNILVLTYKPAVQSAWEEDLKTHIDFLGWQFMGPKEIQSSNDIIKSDANITMVFFASFQDILGQDGKKKKFDFFYDIEWDCVVLDEYHFGSWRDSAKELYDAEEYEIDDIHFEENILNSKTYLYLSGTPFRSLSNGEFTENQIFNWTYSDEQNAKENWNYSQNKENPYLELPQMLMFTYKMDDIWKEAITIGESEDEFNLNLFFKAEEKEKKYKFINEPFVVDWLEMICGGNTKFKIDMFKDNPHTISELPKNISPLPFKNGELKDYLSHTVWFLPDVASCCAMQNLLKNSRNFSEYHIINASGKNAGSGIKALEPVKKYMYDNGKYPTETKTITLTCGKLTTGVSVAPWGGIFMLRNLKSPESYFQAAFRVQTPWFIKDKVTDEKIILKDKCYVFDFAPNRALKLIADYCSSSVINKNTDPEDNISKFVDFLPIFFCNDYQMNKLDAKGLLDFVITGTSSTMLARKFQSAKLINLNTDVLDNLRNNSNLLEELSKIESLRKLKDQLDIIISSENLLKEKKEKKEKISIKEKELIEEGKKSKKEIQDLLIKLVTRLPIFMYLTDDREKTVNELILSVEPTLFIKATGISIPSFKELCALKVFSEHHLNMAILAFKKYEESSLSYLDIEIKKSRLVTGWNSIFTTEEADQILSENSEI